MMEKTKLTRSLWIDKIIIIIGVAFNLVFLLISDHTFIAVIALGWWGVYILKMRRYADDVFFDDENIYITNGKKEITVSLADITYASLSGILTFGYGRIEYNNNNNNSTKANILLRSRIKETLWNNFYDAVLYKNPNAVIYPERY